MRHWVRERTLTFLNKRHNPPENHKNSSETNVYLVSWGFKMQTKMCFMVLEIL